jgi:CBS domain-containing protein
MRSHEHVPAGRGQPRDRTEMPRPIAARGVAASVGDIVRTLCDNYQRRLPVVDDDSSLAGDDGSLAGIASIDDAVAALAEPMSRVARTPSANA